MSFCSNNFPSNFWSGDALRTSRLRAGVSYSALALATMAVVSGAVTTANAATFTASTEAELYSAIAAAQASPDAESTIALTGSFATASTFPAISGTNITIETGANTLTFSSPPQFDIASGATLTLSGEIAGPGIATPVSIEKFGDGELVLDSTGSGIYRIGATEGHTLVNGGGELTVQSNFGFTAPQFAVAVDNNSVASLTVSGAGTRLVGLGTDSTDLSAGIGSQSTLTVEDGAYFGTLGGIRVHKTTSRGLATINVTGAGSTLESAGFTSYNGTSHINVRDGALFNVNGSTSLGGFLTSGFADAQVIAEVSGEGSRWETDSTFRAFRGSLSVLDGGVVTATTVDIATNASGAVPDFSVLVSGSGSELTGDTMTLGTRGTGILTIADDGKVVVGGGAAALVMGGTDADSNAVLNIGGADGEAATVAGTLEASEIQLAASGAINFNHTETGYNFDIPINSTVLGAGAINQVAGQTILTSDQLGFTGLTSVHGGILAVNSALGGTMDVLGGRLQGVGTVGTTTHEADGIIASGNSIGTLTIAGNYVGNGGLVEIETVLGDDSSSTDLLQITGDTSGTGNVKVFNVGGAGAPTTEGIRIIEVGGASDGVFSLKGDYLFEGEQAVVGGAYAYRLYQNGVSTPGDGDWYLRSALVPVVPPVIPPVTPPAPVVPLYQPGVPIYESYANVLQSFNALGTLQQRVGNRSWSGAGVVETGKPADGTIEGNGVWGRIEAAHGKFNPKTSTSGAEYDVDLWKLQAGVDGVLYDGDAGRLIGGISGHYGTISSDVTSIFGDGSISSTGYGLGGTLTWYADSGFYLDGQAQVSWYDSDLSSRTAGLGLTSGNDGFGYGLSIEGGQRIALGSDWSITPQAQLAYSDVNFDDFTDVFGASVGLDRGGSLKGRLGISADYHNDWRDKAGQISRSHVYGIANLYYDFLQGSQIDVAGTEFTSENDALWGGIGIGGSYNWGDDKYSLFGEASLNTSVANFGDSYAVKGDAGLRVKF